MAQKYAAHDLDGNITGFYDEVDSPLPGGLSAIAISDEEWQACLSSQAHTVRRGDLIAPTPPTPEELLTRARSNRIATFRAAEQAAIASGFSSDALGAAHTYAPTPGEVQMLFDPTGDGASLWCKDASGDWSYVAHSAEQVEQVKHDFRAFQAAQRRQVASLIAQVRAAETVAAVQAIAWA